MSMPVTQNIPNIDFLRLVTPHILKNIIDEWLNMKVEVQRITVDDS